MMDKKEHAFSRRRFFGLAAIAGGAVLASPAILAAKVMPEGLKFDQTSDVVILGSGLAGTAAAIEAVDLGAKVILLEAFSVPGGNSAISTGWLNVCNSPMQKKKGIKDSVETFYRDTMRISDNKRDPKLSRIVAEQGGALVSWLMDHGIKFTDDVEPAMGSPKPRCIQVDGYGGALVRTLHKYAKYKGVQIFTRARTLNLYRESYKGENKVVGVCVDLKGKPVNIGARAVVIATGGFVHNKNLINRFNPKWTNCLPTGNATLLGDGLIMACNEGADTINLKEMLVAPTKEVKTKAYLTSGALSGGGILVNEKGIRFVDELKGYTAVSEACLQQKKVFEILVERCHSKVSDFIKKGILHKADSVEQLAVNIGVDKVLLESNISAFNKATIGINKDKFGRQVFREKLVAPFYSMQVSPTLIVCKGGLVINTDAQVLNMSGEPLLKGLYAAGEVTGGYIDYGYRTGDSLSFSGIFGRIAGKKAVT